MREVSSRRFISLTSVMLPTTNFVPLGRNARFFSRHQRPRSPVRPAYALLVLVDLPGLQHQPVHGLKHRCIFRGNEIEIGLADQVLVRMAHELAHALVHGHKAKIFVLDEHRLRYRIENVPQQTRVDLQQRLCGFVASALSRHESISNTEN
jgi:hypothetical protein